MMTELNEWESKKLLEENGINIPKGYLAKYDGSDMINNISTALESLELLNVNQYVIKIISPDIVHKSDVGGVTLNITSNNVISEVYKMGSRIKNKLPEARIKGFYIQELCDPGIECIIGIKEDSQFGKVIMFGLGGIYAEIFKDISMRILPITKEDAQEMITETKVYKILNGYRGKHYDIESIINTIIKISQLADSLDIKELDINPLVVYEKGICCLDARIRL